MNRICIQDGILDACRYFLPRLMFLNTRYAPQLHWGDVVFAFSAFRMEQIDLGSSEFWDQLMLQFRSIADNYRNCAKETTVESLKRRYLKSAAAAYHWAEFMYFSDSSVKTDLRHLVKDCFWSSLDQRNLTIRSGTMSWNNINIPYYLLSPFLVGTNTDTPCIILSNGLDSITEVEIMSFAELFLDSGMAVLLFDGPGQGINLGQNPLCIEIEHVIADLLEHVATNIMDIGIDWSCLGFFGVSFGGYFALRIAKYLGDKFNLVVNYSGGPVLTNFVDMKRRLKVDFQYAMMETDALKMQHRFDQLRLDVSDSNVKIISIHGELDDIFPLKSVAIMDQQLGDKHELIVYSSEAHVCLNYLNQISIDIADKFYKNLVLRIN